MPPSARPCHQPRAVSPLGFGCVCRRAQCNRTDWPASCRYGSSPYGTGRDAVSPKARNGLARIRQGLCVWSSAPGRNPSLPLPSRGIWQRDSRTTAEMLICSGIARSGIICQIGRSLANDSGCLLQHYLYRKTSPYRLPQPRRQTLSGMVPFVAGPLEQVFDGLAFFLKLL